MRGGWRWAIVASALCMSACVSSGESVVGRSAVERPAWVDGNVEDEPQSFVWVVFKKADIFRLDLGIKQAQVAAVAAAPKLLRDRVLNDLYVKAEKILGAQLFAEAKSSIDSIWNEIPVLRDSPDATPAKTYHEEIQREGASGVRVSYDVYVLLSILRHDYELQMMEAMKQMLESKNVSLVKVGQQLQKEFSPE